MNIKTKMITFGDTLKLFNKKYTATCSIDIPILKLNLLCITFCVKQYILFFICAKKS